MAPAWIGYAEQADRMIEMRCHRSRHTVQWVIGRTDRTVPGEVKRYTVVVLSEASRVISLCIMGQLMARSTGWRVGEYSRKHGAVKLSRIEATDQEQNIGTYLLEGCFVFT
uniref:Uncharacterized protein n=1 Tax=Anopheles culicifacies TaxID=139723 RepID=A0A182MET4_9DIPT